MSCDLLEKSYFCSIANNQISIRQNQYPVVICLKNRTFAVSQTTMASSFNTMYSCDLLEKSYFCSIANNSKCTWLIVDIVVICLKNRTFAVSQTTVRVFCIFNFGCDLLEKSYFCSIANNSKLTIPSIVSVVICLKNRTFAVSQTTNAWNCVCL